MQVLISYVCQVVNSFFVAIFCDRCLCCKFKKFPSILIFTLFSAVTFGLKFLSFGSQPALITAIVLYDFKYEGDILEVEHENIHLYFLGYLKYDNE